MKIFAVFMTLLIFLSGFDRCKDEFVVDSDCKEKTSISKNDQENHDKNEVCSPFCQCARCPFSITLPKKQILAIIYRAIANDFFVNIEGNPTGISSSIWQPPKFA